MERVHLVQILCKCQTRFTLVGGDLDKYQGNERQYNTLLRIPDCYSPKDLTSEKKPKEMESLRFFYTISTVDRLSFFFHGVLFSVPLTLGFKGGNKGQRFSYNL